MVRYIDTRFATMLGYHVMLYTNNNNNNS